MIGSRTVGGGLAVAVALLSARPVVAQGPWSARLQLDNDAYNFWRMPGDRPDEEYSNGVRLVFERRGISWWARPFVHASTRCSAASVARTCATATTTLGQDMYTPPRDRQPYEVEDWQQERPYAGWLYLGYETQLARATSMSTLGLSLGVTGKPSLGELSQRIAHQITKFTAPATGWGTQIGFEPGVIASYRHTRLLTLRNAAGNRVMDISPFAGFSAGNILTSGEAGAQLRVGYRLSHPWRPDARASRTGPELFVTVGAREEGVARNIFLDGNTVNRGRSVERTPFVTEYEGAITGKYRGVFLAYRAVTRSREYRTGPRSHAYASMIAGVEVR